MSDKLLTDEQNIFRDGVLKGLNEFLPSLPAVQKSATMIGEQMKKDKEMGRASDMSCEATLAAFRIYWEEQKAGPQSHLFRKNKQ